MRGGSGWLNPNATPFQGGGGNETNIKSKIWDGKKTVLKKN